LTIPFRDDLLQKVDRFAKGEATSREELINNVIEAYVRRKEFENTCAYWNEWAEKTGFTEEDLAEEIRLYRGEKTRNQ
jgi:predicted transcriptional regulator